MNQAANHVELATILALAVAILVPIGIAVVGYIFSGLNKDIKAAQALAEKNNRDLMAAIKDSEARQVSSRIEMENRLSSAAEAQEERMRSHIRDVEARAVAKAMEVEARADKGDSMILQQVNSQYGEVRSRLDQITMDIRALRCMNGEMEGK
jgi:predicted Holliday junction resolvase-like endonuclease